MCISWNRGPAGSPCLPWYINISTYKTLEWCLISCNVDNYTYKTQRVVFAMMYIYIYISINTVIYIRGDIQTRLTWHGLCIYAIPGLAMLCTHSLLRKSNISLPLLQTPQHLIPPSTNLLSLSQHLDCKLYSNKIL